MKTTEILLQADKINHEEIPRRGWADKILMYLVFIIVLSCTALLSSCAVGYETPGYAYGEIGPEYDSFGIVINPWDYNWRHEHQEWIHAHPHWRHDYPRHRGGDREGERR